MQKARGSSLFLLSLGALFDSACGGGSTATVTVTLTTPRLEKLDPSQNERLRVIRVTVRGPTNAQQASADLAQGEKTVRFEGFPTEIEASVKVEGLDEVGNLVAFGERQSINILEEDVQVDVAFRRLLAYVAHEEICGDECPESEVCAGVDGFACHAVFMDCPADCGPGRACVHRGTAPICGPIFSAESSGPRLIYVTDLLTRELVDRVELPGVSPRAFLVSASGGDSVLVPYEDGGQGFVGILSTSDHTWRTIAIPEQVFLTPIPVRHQLALLPPGQPFAAALGGGFLSILNTETLTVVRTQMAPGRPVDGAVGLGGKVVAFVSSPDKVLGVDFNDPTADDSVRSLAEIQGASGLALEDDGQTAVITSNRSEMLAGGLQRFLLRRLNLSTGAVTAILDARGLPAGFIHPVGPAAFSERLPGIFAVRQDMPQIMVFSFLQQDALSSDESIGMGPEARDIAAGPGGQRLIAVSAGTSTYTAAFTTIDVEEGKVPDGSTVRYINDPIEEFIEGFTRGNPPQPRIGHQRYRPTSVAVLYGR